MTAHKDGEYGQNIIEESRSVTILATNWVKTLHLLSGKVGVVGYEPVGAGDIDSR